MKPKKGYIVGVGSRLDNLQTGLDVIGMTEIPFVSQGADLASGVISLATGDYVGAALSVGSLVPGLGQATGAMKMARRAGKVMDAASNIKGTAKQTENFLELTGKSKGIKTSPPKAKQQAIAKNSEVDAKVAKKEKINEKEDVVKNEEVGGRNLDIRDGVTNQLEGKWKETLRRLEKETGYGTSKNIQKTNNQKLKGYVGNQNINPSGNMGKKPLW